jgi:hypothetical protein
MHVGNLEYYRYKKNLVMDLTYKKEWSEEIWIQNFIGTKGKGKKVKISLLQAVEAPRVARGQGSHIT